MPRNPNLVSLIGGLHEGVVDEAAWSQAISEVCDLVDAPKLLMGRVARGGRSLDLTFAHRANLVQAAMLSGPLADPAHNPWLRLAETHPLRTPATVAHLGGQSALEEATIWPNFYVPFQLGDSMGAALERQPQYTDIVVVARPAGAPEFNRASIAAFAEVLPHLARSWRVRHTLINMQHTVGTLTHILDRFERAVVVAGPSGDVRFANAAADRLLTRGGAIDAKSGRLRAMRHDQTKALHALIEAAAQTAIGRSGVAVDAMGLAIEDQPAALSIVAEPLAPAHSKAVGYESSAGALLFIGDSKAATKPSSGRLRIVYGMTEAEARITSMIAAGHSIASLARRLGVSPNTAKFHLKNIFEKVGVTRQADLMRRVLADVGGLSEPDLPGSN